MGLHELYGLAVAAASGERRWSPSCGLGLAEAKRVAEELGGHIAAR